MSQSLSLSLTPRYDLFKVIFDKTFLPDEITEKYQTLLNKDSNVVVSPIDYLNESIQGFHFPGISDLLVEQTQRSYNDRATYLGSIGDRLGTEPQHPNKYISSANPIAQIEDTIAITFRMNVGLYNYLMLYEALKMKIIKSPIDTPNDDLIIYLLNDLSEITAKITLYDILIDSLDGLDFSYSKAERQTETFDLNIRFNNIKFEYIDIDKD